MGSRLRAQGLPLVNSDRTFASVDRKQNMRLSLEPPSSADGPQVLDNSTDLLVGQLPYGDRRHLPDAFADDPEHFGQPFRNRYERRSYGSLAIRSVARLTHALECVGSGS